MLKLRFKSGLDLPHLSNGTITFHWDWFWACFSFTLLTGIICNLPINSSENCIDKEVFYNVNINPVGSE